MNVEDLWKRAGEIAGFISLTNGTVTVSGPYPFAKLDDLQLYGMRFHGPKQSRTLDWASMITEDAECVAARLGVHLFGD